MVLTHIAVLGKAGCKKLRQGEKEEMEERRKEEKEEEKEEKDEEKEEKDKEKEDDQGGQPQTIHKTHWQAGRLLGMI